MHSERTSGCRHCGRRDASITPLVFAGFCSLRALSTTFNDTPERASRPFDRSRDGFVMGEGAGALILESLAHAKKRKARIYAEVAGYAATSEAYHMVIPKEDGLEVANTMRLAMENAGISPSQVDYINAHATSTPIGDAVEAKAIRHVFKSRADRIAINATKSMVGIPWEERAHCGNGLCIEHSNRSASSHDQLRRPGSRLCPERNFLARPTAHREGGALECLWIRE